MAHLAFTTELPKPIVFISHSSDDRSIAIELAQLLGERGIQVCIDHEQIDIGDSIPHAINQGLQLSDCLILLISKSSTKSSWCRAEYESLLMEEINSGKALVIPVVIDDCELPPLLKRKRCLKIDKHGCEQVVFENSDIDELCNTIKRHTNDGRILSLTTYADTKYESSLLAMIMSSTLREFSATRLLAREFRMANAWVSFIASLKLSSKNLMSLPC